MNSHPHYSDEEIVRRGEEIYARDIRAVVETEANIGKMLLIDIETGEYLFVDDLDAAGWRMASRHPGAALYGKWIGYKLRKMIGYTVLDPIREAPSRQVIFSPAERPWIVSALHNGYPPEFRYRPLLLHLPEEIDPAVLSIHYQTVGMFGSYGSFLKEESGQGEYTIPLEYKGLPANSIKILLYCPGYQFARIDIPDLSASPDREIAVPFNPLATISLSGKIVFPHSPPEEYVVTIYYQASWGHSYFGYFDGPTPTYRIATVKPAEEGSFTAALPDFTQDSIVQSYANSRDFFSVGEYNLSARHPRTGKIFFTLFAAEGPRKWIGLPIASHYPEPVIFNAISSE